MESKLQKLARERNWNIAQIRGAFGTIERLRWKLGIIAFGDSELDGTLSEYLSSLENFFEVMNDKHWEEQKAEVNES